jgi:hypothetical protein
MADPSFLRSLDVSYGDALLNLPLKKVMERMDKDCSVPVNMQPHPDRERVSLWAARESGTDEGVVLDVAVLYGDEPCPDGFRKIQRELSAGAAATKSFLCYRVGVPTSATKAVAAVAVLPEGMPAPGEFHFSLPTAAQSTDKAPRPAPHAGA